MLGFLILIIRCIILTQDFGPSNISTQVIYGDSMSRVYKHMIDQFLFLYEPISFRLKQMIFMIRTQDHCLIKKI